MRFMEKAVQFEQESNHVRVKYGLSVDGIDGIELRTVLEAMEVSFIPICSLYIYLCCLYIAKTLGVKLSSLRSLWHKLRAFLGKFLKLYSFDLKSLYGEKVLVNTFLLYWLAFYCNNWVNI